MEKLLTTGEACRLLGLSRSTVRRACAGGHLMAKRTPGGHLRFAPSAVAAFDKTLTAYRTEPDCARCADEEAG